MILALLTSVALASPLGEDDHQRLLGALPDASPVAAPASAPASGVPFGWPLGGVVVGGGLLWFARKRALTPLTPAQEVRVVGRAVLGKDAGVSVLEVRDAQGQWRRLLIGTGAQGPQLITGLGAEPSSVDDLPEVPAFPVASAVTAAAATTPAERPRPMVTMPPLPARAPAPAAAPRVPMYTPGAIPPVLRSAAKEPRSTVPVRRHGAPARSYADVAAAFDEVEPARQQTRPKPQTTARDALAMIEEVRRARRGSNAHKHG